MTSAGVDHEHYSKMLVIVCTALEHQGFYWSLVQPRFGISAIALDGIEVLAL